jgi:hypothetical protein
MQISWVQRAIDVASIARRTWALPRATAGAADLLAALNDEKRGDPTRFLPFSVASAEHPVLLYRRLYGRGDTVALERLKSVVTDELGAVLGLYDRLREQS